jgi:hypothetical protein
MVPRRGSWLFLGSPGHLFPFSPTQSLCPLAGVQEALGDTGVLHQSPEPTCCEPPRGGHAPSVGTVAGAYREDRGPKGVRKQETPLCRRLRNACSTSLASEAGSMRQKDPFPGSSWERGTLMK